LYWRGIANYVCSFDLRLKRKMDHKPRPPRVKRKLEDMKTIELCEKLHDNVIYRSTPIPFCNIEKGLKLIVPTGCIEESGTVFAGNYEEFKGMQDTLSGDCTYIVCCNEKDLEIPKYNTNVNVIFLDTSLTAAISLLTAIIQENTASEAANREKVLLDFWNDIIYFKIRTQAEVNERIKAFPYKMHRHMACIVVRAERNMTQSHVYKVTNHLQNFFPDTNLFYTGSEWVVLYTQEKSTTDELDIDYNAFSKMLEADDLNAGISYVCQLTELLRTIYMTADAALNLGLGLGIKPYINRIYTFHQLNIYYIIDMCAQAFSATHKTDNLIFLTHPDVTRLYYYDIDNNNNLLEVMFEYLLNGQNTSLTAQALFMHRNTVINKLNKIEEVLGYKVDYEKDHFLFLISFMVLNYQHKYAKNNISKYFSQHDFSIGDDKE